MVVVGGGASGGPCCGMVDIGRRNDVIVVNFVDVT